MKITLILADGDKKIIQTPEFNNYPEVLIQGGRAFKHHPKTDEYEECSVWVIPLSQTWHFLNPNV
jgi:hypothetical protein